MRFTLLALIILLSPIAHAHKASDSYLWIDRGSETDLSGRWDIAVIDLERIVGLDANSDGDVTWGELRARAFPVMSYALDRLALSVAGQDCIKKPGQLLVDTHAGESYASFSFTADCNGSRGDLEVDYSLLFASDPGHRGFLRVDLDDQSYSAVLSPGERTWTQAGEGSVLSGARDFLGQGIHHILIGYDHIAFLVLLLLPAVVRRKDGRWEGVSSLRVAMIDMAGVVTAFTVAHSITLTVAALNLVVLPSRPVELAIAASVVIAGLHNLFPLRIAPRWAIALGFGLVHGFGFASVLADLGNGDRLVIELAAFNIGVELGQLAIAATLLPLAYLLRRTRVYRHAILPGGSLAIAALASFWVFERAVA